MSSLLHNSQLPQWSYTVKYVAQCLLLLEESEWSLFTDGRD